MSSGKPQPIKTRRVSGDSLEGGKKTRNARVSAEKKTPRVKPTTTAMQSDHKRFANMHDEARWQVAQKWAPRRALLEHELAAARKIFYDLDRDGSGSLDADELGSMLRSLGHDPTHEEIVELIKSVDVGNSDDDQGDGQIQFREFIVLYAQGLDSKGKAGAVDAVHLFQALGGDTQNDKARVTVSQIHDSLVADYGLDIDVSASFGLSGQDLSLDEVKTTLLGIVD